MLIYRAGLRIFLRKISYPEGGEQRVNIAHLQAENLLRSVPHHIEIMNSAALDLGGRQNL